MQRARRRPHRKVPEIPEGLEGLGFRDYLNFRDDLEVRDRPKVPEGRTSRRYPDYLADLDYLAHLVVLDMPPKRILERKKAGQNLRP